MERRPIPVKRRSNGAKLVKKVYFVLAILIALLIVYRSLDYLQPDFSTGFLSDKKDIFESHYKYFLYAHMLSAPWVLLLGVFQLWFTGSSLHRFTGRLYVALIVLLAAPSALGMSFYAIGGVWSILSFSLLTLLWVLFTLLSYRYIRRGDVKKHREFMIRSFILTNSAVLLRIFLFINNYYALAEAVTGYIIIAWLSWLPWLVLYELRLKWGEPRVASTGIP